MTFANQPVLFALVLLPLLILSFILAERRRRKQLQAMVRQTEGALVMGAGFERRLLYLVFLLLAVGLLVVAAARPQWGTKLEEVRTKGIDILIAVDVSESMRATDVSPNRMAKARQQVEKFLNLLKGDRVGLIAFAGSAYSYCPLTVDYSAIRLFLNGLEPGVIADGGTNLPAAIKTAMKTFERSEGSASKILVIFSDGENHEADPMPAVREAVAQGIQIFTVGIGNVSKAGERIPLEDKQGETSYKLDQQGNLVITRLDEATLQNIAREGNGEYYRVSEAGTELVNIYRKLMAQQEAEFSSKMFHQKEDQYQIPLVIGLLCFLLAHSLGNRSFKKLRRTQGVLS